MYSPFLYLNIESLLILFINSFDIFVSSNITLLSLFYKNTFKDTYQILEFNNTGKSNSFYLSENELPNGISVDKVLLKVNGEFKIDNTLTKNIMNEIENYAKEISKAQNERLDQYFISFLF